MQVQFRPWDLFSLVCGCGAVEEGCSPGAVEVNLLILACFWDHIHGHNISLRGAAVAEAAEQNNSTHGLKSQQISTIHPRWPTPTRTLCIRAPLRQISLASRSDGPGELLSHAGTGTAPLASVALHQGRPRPINAVLKPCHVSVIMQIPIPTLYSHRHGPCSCCSSVGAHCSALREERQRPTELKPELRGWKERWGGSPVCIFGGRGRRGCACLRSNSSFPSANPEYLPGV